MKLFYIKHSAAEYIICAESLERAIEVYAKNNNYKILAVTHTGNLSYVTLLYERTNGPTVCTIESIDYEATIKVK